MAFASSECRACRAFAGLQHCPTSHPCKSTLYPRPTLALNLGHPCIGGQCCQSAHNRNRITKQLKSVRVDQCFCHIALFFPNQLILPPLIFSSSVFYLHTSQEWSCSPSFSLQLFFLRRCWRPVGADVGLRRHPHRPWRRTATVARRVRSARPAAVFVGSVGTKLLVRSALGRCVPSARLIRNARAWIATTEFAPMVRTGAWSVAVANGSANLAKRTPSAQLRNASADAASSMNVTLTASAAAVAAKRPADFCSALETSLHDCKSS